MNIRYILLAIITKLSLISCSETIKGEGPIINDKKEVSSKAKNISVEYAMNLILSDDLNEGEILITANENIHQYIFVRENDNYVKIELANNNYRDVNIYIEASAKQFSNISASGASKVSIEGESSSFDDYNISLSGASEVDLAAELNVNSCTIKASGASSVRSKNFSTDDLIVNLSGASKVTIGVNNSISGTLSGASAVRYWGNPNVTTKNSGASVVEKL